MWGSFWVLSVLVAGVARPGRFIPEETAHRNHCTEGWVGLGFGLNVLRKRNTWCLYRFSKQSSDSKQLVWLYTAVRDWFL